MPGAHGAQGRSAASKLAFLVSYKPAGQSTQYVELVETTACPRVGHTVSVLPSANIEWNDAYLPVGQLRHGVDAFMSSSYIPDAQSIHGRPAPLYWPAPQRVQVVADT